MKNRFIQKIARTLEEKAARIQGKGWGVGTVDQEFEMASSLMGSVEKPLFVDIGGNKGTYTSAILKKFPNCSVVVFEPAQVNQEILRNKFSSQNVIIEPFAVSDTASTSVLHSNAAGSGLASLAKRRLDHHGIDFEHREEVTTVRFDDYWKNYLERRPINFCKIDIEGHELAALNGFGEAIEHINLIQFEFGGCNIDTRTFFQDFWYFSKPKGFKIFRMTPSGLSWVESYSEFDESFRTTNFLAHRGS